MNAESKILYECREQDACETYPKGLPPFLQSQIYTSFKSLDPSVYVGKMARQGRKTDPTTARYEVWNLIVQTYSQTLLTVPGDK
jgi:hypothetical protein